MGRVAEWLCRGLQILVRRFDSGPGLHLLESTIMSTHLSHFGRQAAPPQFLVIFLHGYGANGANLLSLSWALEEALPSAVFVAPNAFTPLSSYGKESYQWFELENMSPEYLENSCMRAVEKGVTLIRSLQTTYDVPGERTILVGFSQGTMMALALALSEPSLCRSVIGCAGGLYMDKAAIKALPETLKIYLIHGNEDTVVPFLEAEKTLATLKSLGFNVNLFPIPALGHSIDDQVVENMKKILRDL